MREMKPKIFNSILLARVLQKIDPGRIEERGVILRNSHMITEAGIPLQSQ